MRTATSTLALLAALSLAALGCADENVNADSGDTDGHERESGVGEPAQLDVGSADRADVREVPLNWPPGADSYEQGEVVGTLTGEELAPVRDELSEAHYIDIGAVDYDLPPPDYEVAFLDGDTTLERLGYYEQVTEWGEHEVSGRWLHDWDQLDATIELPQDALP